ncbi:DUF881 domain-containing protein [Tissierella creatinini]|nr:DUF881 domain-containing protein [Tissierella creatinini]TJX64425.1 DUF881 domain-containing protein [Soehngenia saccharolytica]
MKNQNPKIILGLFSIIVGILISTQMKLKVESIAPITLKSLQTTKDEITFLNNEIYEMEKIIEQKEEELQTIMDIHKGEENIVDILQDDLEVNMTSSGRTALEGPGIKITMYDNMSSEIIGLDINDDVIHDVDILNILNDLKIAGAEAISINDQRVVATSEIICGGPIIRINGKSIGTPFFIKAIGDPKLLMASVNAPGTYGDILRSVYQIGFEPELQESIRIPAYKGNFNYTYAKPVGEGE